MGFEEKQRNSFKFFNFKENFNEIKKRRTRENQFCIFLYELENNYFLATPLCLETCKEEAFS